MRFKRFCFLMGIAIFLFSSNLMAQEDFLNPYTPDENTVLLLHFENDLADASDSTAGGIEQGTLSYIPGLANLGNCLYINNGAITNHSRVIVPDTAALDLTGSFTLETWVYFLTFGEGWDDWRGAPRLMAKPFAANSSYPGSWWFPNYWLMGDSNNDIYIFGGGFMGIDPADSSWTTNGDLRLDYNFVETQKWYHVAFIYDHDAYPRTEQLLIHDENGDLLVMLNREINDSTYVIATSDSALCIGEGGEGPGGDSWLDGFLDEMRISTVARRFATPPVISGTSNPGNTTDTQGPYEIKTKVTDFDGIKSVTLKYDVGAGWTDLAMTSAVGDTFSCSVPGQQPGTIIKYYVEAVDNNDDSSVDPATAPDVYYSFAIIVEKALVFHLDFEEGSGTPLDKSQFGHAITVNGDVTYSTDAASGTYSGQFNSSGADGYLTAAASAFMNCYEFTVEMWIKANSFQTNLRLIIKEGGSPWYMPNYEIKASTAGNIEAGSYCNPGGWNNFSSDSIVATGSWHHIAYVFKDTLATVYILNADDKIIDEVTKVQVGVPVFTTADLQIGHAQGDGAGPYYDGLMDEVKIYNYAKGFEYQWKPLTADENTVLLCHFDGDLSDASGVQPDGIASNDKVGYAESFPGLGQALYLDNSAEGDSALVTFADANSLDLLKKYSVEASFMLLSDDDSWNSSPRVWAKPSGEKPWYCPDYWGMVTSSNKFGVGYYTGSTWHDIQSEDGLCKTNTWYHIYMLYDETADSTVYFAVYDTLGAVIYEQTNAIGDKIDEFTTALPLYIGFGGGGTDSYLNGYIDELRIQNYEYVTAIDDGDKFSRLPSEYQLSQNYPNPFNPVTNISYVLPKSGKVELIIYNVLGEKVRLLVNENQNAGSYSLIWDGNNSIGNKLPTGIYFYRLKAGEFTAVKKMILIK